ncbi:MAG: restriction endonuclease [Acidimicrobiales bacterium]
MSGDSFYEVLGVDAGASQAEIKVAYHRLSRQVHPDLGGSDALFRRVSEAYATLSDERRRASYDAHLRSARDRVERDDRTGESDGDSGWVRVDGHPGAPHGAQPPPGWDTSGGGWTGPSETGRSGVPGDEPRGTAAYHDRGTLSQLFNDHPAGFLAVLGVILVMVAPVLPFAQAVSLVFVGLLCVAAGCVALIGSRRIGGSSRTRGSSIDDVDVMTGTQFELLLVGLFTRAGYRVRHTGRRGDLGADLVIERPGSRTVVQAKRSTAPVGHRAVQEAVGAIAPYGANGAMVVTNATFTAHAQALASANRVILWDRWALLREMTRSLGPASGPVGTQGGRFGGAQLRTDLRRGAGAIGRAGIFVFSLWAEGSIGSNSAPRRRRGRGR